MRRHSRLDLSSRRCWRLGLALAGGLALALGAWTPPAGAADPLQVVLGGEPTSMDPSVDTLKSSLVITNTMLETLAMNTPAQTFKPWLAESWQLVAPTKWRLKLKHGAKFHNGEPFDADAVIYSVKVFRETKGLARGWFGFLAGAEKVDDYTVDLVTSQPTAIVPSSLAFLYVFPPKYHAQVGSEGFAKKPVGTGAWRFVSWTPGVQFKVEPNPDYWGRKPAIGEIHFRWAAEGSSRVALLETGEVHLAQNIPPALAERIERSGTARVEAVKSIRKVFIQFNINEGPTKDPRVRRALNHAVDVESIIRTLFRGRAYGRDKGLILEGFEGYQGASLQPFKYDPELAKKLLAEAGYANGFETTLWHPIGRYMLDKEASQAIAGQLARVGVKAKLEGMETGAYFAKMSKEKVPGMNFFACGPLYMNPIFCSLVHHQPGAAFAYGADERTAQFIKSYTETLDEPKRAKVVQDFERYVYDEQVSWIWLWHQQDIYGASNKVNWKPRSDELMTFEEVSFK
jgi:peptide/nickel transport system substrate-binding protein